MRFRYGISLIEVIVALSILIMAIMSLAGMITPMQNASTSLDENDKAAAIAQMLAERILGSDWGTIGKTPTTWHRNELAESDLTRQWVEHVGDPDGIEFKHHPLIDEPAGPSLYTWLQDPDGDGDPKDAITIAEFTDDFGNTPIRDQFGLPFLCQYDPDAYGNEDASPGSPAVDAPATLTSKYDTPQRYNWLQFLGLLDGPSGLDNLEVYIEYYEMGIMDSIASHADWNRHEGDDENNPLVRAQYQLPQSHLALDLNVLPDMDRDAIIVRILLVWDRSQSSSIGTGRHELLLARRR